MSNSRILDRDVLKQQVEQARSRGESIVFTNGCFDLLHAGHVRYLEAAARLGDHLIVAVNSDTSVRRLKGSQRPIIPQAQRIEVIAALRAVSWVAVFEESTAVPLLRLLQPQIYVKGGDYKSDEIPERSCLNEWGAKLVLLDCVPELSTSVLIRRIREGSSQSSEAKRSGSLK